jgi:hypothetical protein
MGSDEVEAKFFDFSNRAMKSTYVFGDVDAGETRNIPAEQSCMAPQPTCNRGASNLAFGVTLVEVDGYVGGFFDPEFCHGSLGDPSAMPPTPEQYEATFDSYAGDTCYGDDLIGRAKVKLSQTGLMALLPTVGASVDTTVRLSGGAGRYDFTYRITRLPNAINIPEVGPAVLVNAISLTATAATNPSRAVLTWSGATTATVDIYRDGLKFVSTSNDGAFDDTRPPGTYQYRLCDLGSTTACSAVVSVVVT